MFIKLTDFILKKASRISFIIFLFLFIVIEIIFNTSTPKLVEQTNGHKLLDMEVAYSSDFAYEQLESYKNAGAVFFRIRVADFFFPAVYAFTFSILSAFIYRKKYSEPDNYRWVLCVPFAAAVSDYIENIIIVILYRSLPAHFPAAASVLNVVTIIKFSFIGLTLLLIATGALSLLKGGDSGLIIGNKFRGKK